MAGVAARQAQTELNMSGLPAIDTGDDDLVALANEIDTIDSDPAVVPDPESLSEFAAFLASLESEAPPASGEGFVDAAAMQSAAMFGWSAERAWYFLTKFTDSNQKLRTLLHQYERTNTQLQDELARCNANRDYEMRRDFKTALKSKRFRADIRDALGIRPYSRNRKR